MILVTDTKDFMETRTEAGIGRRKKLRGHAHQKWWIRLYVAGETSQTAAAISKARWLCEEDLEKQYTLQVINLYKDQEIRLEDHILEINSMLRKLPAPLARIFKDLHQKERVLIGIELRPRIPE